MPVVQNFQNDDISVNRVTKYFCAHSVLFTFYARRKNASASVIDQNRHRERERERGAIHVISF